MPIRRRFGQNFLTDANALARIVDALQLSGDEHVVEIGPGRGALTDRLALVARRLTCIEIDRDLVAELTRRFATSPQVCIVSGDVLETDLESVAGAEPFVLVGNVPYYITTPILFQAIAAARMQRAVFLVQREVADRLLAAPGSEDYGALTANVALTCHVEFVGAVPAGAFFPKPRVNSAIVRLRPREDPVVPLEAASRVRAFIVALFGQRRRQLVRALRTVTGVGADEARAAVLAAGLDPACRAEAVDAPGLARLHASCGSPNVRDSTARS